MAGTDNWYSLFVQWAKVVFPLAALGLLSTLFLFSRTIDPSDAIPFAEIDVEQIARDQQMSAPRFSGATKNGSAITVDAQSAMPDLQYPRRITVRKVVARIETESGTSYGITAEAAYYDGETDILELEGDVRLSTSTGYRVRTDAMTTDLETNSVTTDTKVVGRGPAGELEAGSMALTTGGDTQVLVFKNGVKLIYQPKE